MTVINAKEIVKETCDLKVKIRCGASLVKIKPLFTRDTKHLIVCSGSDVKVFSILSGECVQTLRYHKKPVISLQENKRNPLQIFSCSDDATVVRWHYAEGKVLQVYNLPVHPVRFYIPSADGPWFVVKKINNSDKYSLNSVTNENQKCMNTQQILKHVLPDENTIAFGFQGTIVASVCGSTLIVCKIATGELISHKTGLRKLKCVAFHPSELILATGDHEGRIIVWSNLFDRKKLIRSVYHWHTLPVADLMFSSEGSYLYSGGGESTLVKWKLFSEIRYILPRLGSPIHRLCTSQDNSYVVTAHEDNALQILNSQRCVTQVIQGLVKGKFRGTKSRTVLATGMLYDPRTKALVMNGRPGHLQFYNIHEDKQLYNLDISGRNIITDERNAVILNVDVQKAAFDDKGLWLATSEYWDDEETSPQLWLKFWQFDITKQTFVLNTNVILPHNKEIKCIVFQPIQDDITSLPLCVTTSTDGRFKIWILKEDSSASKQSWGCESMGCYRDLPANSACFSEEGSLLAVSFGSVATLWTVERITLKAVLCHDKSERNIEQLMFGRQSCSHLLVCQDGISITVWNVLSLSIAWIVHSKIQTLASDMSSDVIAAFCENQDLIIFKPNNPDPLYSLEHASEKPVIAALFVPKNTETDYCASCCFHKKSLLLFCDEEQNLHSLLEGSDVDFDLEEFQKKTVMQNIPLTPFGMLQAEQKVSNVEIVEPQQLIIHSSDKRDFISYPTFQNPLALCSSILPKLLIPLKNSKNSSDSQQVNEVMDIDVSSEPHKIQDNAIPDDANKSCEEVQCTTQTDIIDIDFCFLIGNIKLSSPS